MRKEMITATVVYDEQGAASFIRAVIDGQPFIFTKAQPILEGMSDEDLLESVSTIQNLAGGLKEIGDLLKKAMGR